MNDKIEVVDFDMQKSMGSARLVKSIIDSTLIGMSWS